MRLPSPLRSLLAAALLAPLLLPGVASASSVTADTYSYQLPKSDPETGTDVTWTADPGEANRLQATATMFGYVVRDDAGPVRALIGCSALPDGAAFCHAPGYPRSFNLLGGDGDDELRTDGPTEIFTVDGGEGDDTIVAAGRSFTTRIDGGPGSDTITGSPGADEIAGGTGADLILAGPGADEIVDDPPGGPFSADRIDGGEGGDGVAYERSTPVHVDLGAGSGGAPGEGDLLIAIEDVGGGPADDRLIGDDGPNRIDAHVSSTRPVGDDHVEGRGGDDRIGAGSGGGTLLGGDGDDSIAASGATIDGGAGDDVLSDPRGTIRCGAGGDTAYVSQTTTAASDCERIGVADVTFGDLRANGRRLRLTIGFSGRGGGRSRCGAQLSLRDAGDDLRPLARRFVRLRRGQRRTVELRAAGPLPAHVLLVGQAVGCVRGRSTAAPPSSSDDGFLFEPFDGGAP